MLLGANRYLVSDLRVIFLVGMSLNQTSNEQIEKEYHLYGDIVREIFFYTYRNLTSKTIMGIRWASIFCHNAKYVLKSDDNILLNTYRLVNYLEKSPTKTNTFLCKPHFNAVVVRHNSSKFYVPKTMYQLENYPTCKKILFTVI